MDRSVLKEELGGLWVEHPYGFAAFGRLGFLLLMKAEALPLWVALTIQLPGMNPSWGPKTWPKKVASLLLGHLLVGRALVLRGSFGTDAVSAARNAWGIGQKASP